MVLRIRFGNGLFAAVWESPSANLLSPLIASTGSSHPEKTIVSSMVA
jgi:hypothetical protein